MATTVSDKVLKLEQISRENIPLAGVKAANLGEMIQAGFPVPEGFVLTTQAFDEFSSVNSLSIDSTPEEVEQAEIPSDIVEILSVAAIELSDVPLAVRSSGVAEDLAGASFAGQYETALDVRGADELVAAVRKCWASAFSQRVNRYRTAYRQSGIPKMAVLVQRLVKADAAGVAFSANPVTGDRDEIVVSAVRGLGERLVSGQASPDEWAVRGDEAKCRYDPEKAIDSEKAKSIAEMARRVEAYFKTPQDIEWAFAGDKLYLLQARPITALPLRPEIDVPAKGFWTKDSGHFPEPITPFGESIYLSAIENGLRLACREFGLPLEGVDNRALGGEVYAHVVPFGGKEGKPPPSWVIFLASRLLPTFRRLRRTAQGVMDSNQPEIATRRWFSEWREQIKQEGRQLLSQDLIELDDAGLVERLEHVIDFIRRGQVVHMRLRVPYVFALYEFTLACKELLGWNEAKSMSLLASDFSSEPGVRLADLSSAISQSQVARRIVAESESDVLVQLRQAVPEIAKAFESYLNEYGHRPVNYEPGSPTLAERPEFFIRLLRDRLRDCAVVAHIDPVVARKESIKSARAALSGRSSENQQRFERALAFAELAYPMREDDIFYTDNVPCALARYTAIEIGRRLVAEGVLNNAGDAVFVKESELRDALGGRLTNLQMLVDRRKAERVWVAAHPGPFSYGKDPGPPPDPRAMPQPLRFMTEAQMWYIADQQRMPGGVISEGQIAGAAGSPGRYTGMVRIVHNESEFSRLGPGEVLVCPITTPAWSVLFSQAGAVVTDGGGVLSHAAIIAREHGIPAVLGTGDATHRLRDGQIVTVDGTQGIVQTQA